MEENKELTLWVCIPPAADAARMREDWPTLRWMSAVFVIDVENIEADPVQGKVLGTTMVVEVPKAWLTERYYG